MSNVEESLTYDLSIPDPFLADYQYKIIIEEIADFEKDLDNNHEIALKLCNFGQSILLNVTEIGYHNPNLMFFLWVC